MRGDKLIYQSKSGLMRDDVQVKSLCMFSVPNLVKQSEEHQHKFEDVVKDEYCFMAYELYIFVALFLKMLQVFVFQT